MESGNKLFLLDAYALIYRAYYAFIKNPKNQLQRVQYFSYPRICQHPRRGAEKGESVTHIGVAFDPAGPTFRHEAFEQYKAQREETPEAIRLSVPIIKDIIRAYRIPILEVAGYEADDVIGTSRHRSRTSGHHHLYDDSRQRLRPAGDATTYSCIAPNIREVSK